MARAIRIIVGMAVLMSVGFALAIIAKGLMTLGLVFVMILTGAFVFFHLLVLASILILAAALLFIPFLPIHIPILLVCFGICIMVCFIYWIVRFMLR